MSTIGNIFLQNNPYERFVQQLVQLESRTKLQLQSQKSTQNEKKTALGAVSSSISKFISKVDELQDPLNKSFRPLSSSTSNRDVVTIESFDGIKKPADFSITVNRVATNDILLSEITEGSNTTLSALGNGSIEITIGEKTETISVETTYEDEEGVIQQKTNSEILAEFAEKVSDAFEDSARANRFYVSGDNVQLSIQSLNTGFDNRVQFSNATGVLAEIMNGSTRNTPESELNAQFTIDGVNFERSENTVDDAIEGLTLRILKANLEPELIRITENTAKARSNIDGFISAFNEMNRTIRDRTFLDSANNRRGALQDVRVIRNLTLNLRQTGLLSMGNAEEGQLSRLSEIGIDFRQDGTMYIENSDLLNEALAERSVEVEKLFTGEDSIVSQMKTQAEVYTKSKGGIISAIENGFDQQISRLDSRIAAQDRYLKRYEEEQRTRFNQLQAIIERGDAQFTQVINFRRATGF